MTNEEAINILRGIRLENLNLDDAYTKDRYDALVMAIEALERSEKFQRKAEVVISQLRTDRDRLEEAHRWIPVSERLPEKEGDYLTTVMGIVSNRYEILSFTKNLYKVDKYDFPDKKEPGWYFLDREYGFIEETDVIAWMPLPEIYKEESNKGE